MRLLAAGLFIALASTHAAHAAASPGPDASSGSATAPDSGIACVTDCNPSQKAR